ncbi:hypothetical protein DL89DRAFT_267090 [Linderina pennispora]|uniref:6,7-dimethyl-8-ribityllumazine synthase n=1 Tax=Linderina pennispora TaxID=61395 RepID=A0A1Y1WCQ0_9FUNG|nr:uncharacterized protein DL89DRAFT_267090 [Linderina pennispora]ORX70996.1 hypothetical protein DL89DRAFT_267090 [Linderina pennispora]
MTFDAHGDSPVHVPLIRREVSKIDYSRPPRIGLVYSSENWDDMEALVNDLRYELTDTYNISPIQLKTTQAESIYDLPLFISHLNSRCDIVLALGVVYRNAPDYEPRLVTALTQRLSGTIISRIPVFDCILVRQSRVQLEEHVKLLKSGGSGFGKIWASRAIDAFNVLSKPAI